jgi:hypothetical protein
MMGNLEYNLDINMIQFIVVEQGGRKCLIKDYTDEDLEYALGSSAMSFY